MSRVKRKASHTVFNMRVHLVWITKYRYKVLKGPISIRIRELMRQYCCENDIYILKGVVSNDHVYLYISYPPHMSVSNMIKRIKGMTSRKIQQEYPELNQRYWGKNFWAVGYGCFSYGEVDDKIIQNYLDNHDTKYDSDDNFIVE